METWLSCTRAIHFDLERNWIATIEPIQIKLSLELSSNSAYQLHAPCIGDREYSVEGFAIDFLSRHIEVMEIFDIRTPRGEEGNVPSSMNSARIIASTLLPALHAVPSCFSFSRTHASRQTAMIARMRQEQADHILGLHESFQRAIYPWLVA